MPDLITQRMKLKDAFPEARCGEICKTHNVKEDAEYVRKGLVPADLDFVEGERAVIARITTNGKDRDNEIVEPGGAILTDYENHPVVLFGHDHRSLPIGRSEWIKTDAKGLVSKTVYANTEKANEIYQYRKDGFPLAESIGFIPVESKVFKEGDPEYKEGVRRAYTKWILLEYSDVSVPSNPEALEIAVSKGLFTEEDAGMYSIIFEETESEEGSDTIKKEIDEQIDGVPGQETASEEEKSEEEDNIGETKHIIFGDDFSGLTEEQRKECEEMLDAMSDGIKINLTGIQGYSIEEKLAILKYAHEMKLATKPGWDENDSSIRYRVREPGEFEEGSMRTVPLKADKPKVNSVMGKLKGEDSMTVQSLIFPKEDGWDMAKAKVWLKDNEDAAKMFKNLLKAIDEEEKTLEEEEQQEEKAGRVLSAKNRKVIKTALLGMTEAIKALNELMSATEVSKPEDVVDVKPEEVEDEKGIVLVIEDEVEEKKEEKDEDIYVVDVDVVKDLLNTVPIDTMKNVVKDAVSSGIRQARGEL